LSVIRAHGLKKTYASDVTGQPIRALDGAGIEVEAGEIFGILGPNGAGKTTLLNCLSLLLKPDEGSIEMFGMDALKFHNKLRARLNMSSGNSNFPWCMTVREILRFYGMLYGIGFAPLKKKTDELLGLLSLEPYADRRFDELSTGTKQRLALAKALLNDPEILFLDEPTIGLDPDVSIKLRGFIQPGMHRGHARRVLRMPDVVAVARHVERDEHQSAGFPAHVFTKFSFLSFCC